MLYKIGCNPIHPFYAALPVPVRVTRCFGHMSEYIRVSSKYCRTFISLSVFLWNDLADCVFDGVGLVGYKSKPMFFISRSCLPSFVIYCFSFHFFFPIGWYCGAVVWTDRV